VRPADRKLDFRGHDGEQIIKPGGGLKPEGGADRPHAGTLPKPGGDKRPDMGQIKEGLKNKPGGAQAALQDRKADLGKAKPDLGKGKADLSKAKAKVQARPAGNAFDPRDGAKAKDFAKRGQASLGDRGAKQFAKPSMAKPKAVVRQGGPARVGGGRPGGGHVKRGGGRRR
jgi:hypothetical protein